MTMTSHSLVGGRPIFSRILASCSLLGDVKFFSESLWQEGMSRPNVGVGVGRIVEVVFSSTLS